jgi:uncharacterized OsmC-like protein
MAEKQVDNGVNVEALLGAREHLIGAPEAAQFTWRATCEWVGGTYSKSSTKGFFGLGEEHEHKAEYNFESDHPACFASEDRAATPVEMILASLAHCITGSVAAVAQNWKIQLNSVTSTVEGRMNILGMLGGDPEVRNGFESIVVKYKIDADASEDDIKSLVAHAQKRSAAYDIITNPTNVRVEVNQ